MSPKRPTRLVLVNTACGVFLLAAVVLKVQGMASRATQPLALFAPWVQLAGVEAEALVGMWLLSGYARRGAWLAGVGLFTILAAVSVYLIFEGQKSCGCFGRVEVSPWGSLTLDLACVVALITVRPAGGVKRATVWQASLVVVSVGVLVLLASSTAVQRQVARLRGEVVILPNGDADVGVASGGEVRVFEVRVENLTDSDVRLVGGTSNCACVATDDLPLTIPAGGATDVHVRVKFTGEPGRFRHTFHWYTDAPAQPRLGGRVTGRVAAAE